MKNKIQPQQPFLTWRWRGTLIYYSSKPRAFFASDYGDYTLIIERTQKALHGALERELIAREYWNDIEVVNERRRCFDMLEAAMNEEWIKGQASGIDQQ